MGNSSLLLKVVVDRYVFVQRISGVEVDDGQRPCQDKIGDNFRRKSRFRISRC